MITLEGADHCYSRAIPVCNFNSTMDEEHYWIKYLRLRKNPLIKVYNTSIPGYSDNKDDYPIYFIPLFFLTEHVGYQIRSLKTDRRMICKAADLYCYTPFSVIKNFKSGVQHRLPYMCIVEGPMDAEVVSEVVPNVVACCGSMPSKNLITALSAITDEIIFIPDNDETGKIQGKRIEKYVKDTVKYLRVSTAYPDHRIKDFGDLARVENVGIRRECLENLKGRVLYGR